MSSNISSSRSRPWGPTLRSSCDCCAETKVGCTKEKPACKRCASRGLPCRYSVTKRAGRTSKSKQQEQQQQQPAAPSSTSSPPAMTATAPGNITLAGTPLPPTPITNDQISATYSHLVASLLSFQADQIWQPLAMASPMPDELFPEASAAAVMNSSFSEPWGAIDLDPMLMTPQNSNSSINNDLINTFSPFLPSAGSDLPPLTPLTQPDVNQSSLTSQSQSTTNVCADMLLKTDTSNADPGCCLFRALYLFRQLSLRTGGDGAEAPETDRSFDSVLQQNQSTLEAVLRALQCTCATDAYLLVMLALITSKVMDWFAAAAESGQRPSQRRDSGRRLTVQAPTPPQSNDDDPSESVDVSYFAAHGVMSELHSVQRTVNELATHLKTMADEKRLDQQITDSESSDLNPEPASGINLPSAASPTLSQTLEADLRQRIRTLSQSVLAIIHGISSHG